MKKAFTIIISSLILSGNAFAQWSQLAANHDALRSTCFTSADTGFVAGGGSTILKTTDGGVNWTIKRTGGIGIEKIVFPATDTGYAIASEQELYYTQNNGENWYTTPLSLGYYQGMHFLNPAVGYIFGQAFSGNAAIFKTVDGASTWNTLTFGATSRVTDGCFPSPMIGYACGYNWGTGEGTFYKTTDGGTSWTPQTISLLPNYISFNGIYFTDTLTGYATGKYSSPANSGAIYKTTDGGVTWTSQFITGAADLFQVQFVNDSVGYVAGILTGSTGCGTSLVLKTTDAGQTWNIQNTGPYVYGLRSLSFLNENLGYCVESCGGGGVGSILKYNNVSSCFSYYSVDVIVDSAASTTTFNLAIDSLTATQAVGYFWDFGDGFTSTSPLPSHVVNIDTAYNVCMTIYTLDGDSCTYCHLIGKDYLSNIIRTQGYIINIVNPLLATGIIKQPEESTISIYPNPSESVFNVLTHKAGAFTITVYDLLGKVVAERKGDSGNAQIDLSNQSKGTYILEVRKLDQVSHFKIEKK